MSKYRRHKSFKQRKTEKKIRIAAAITTLAIAVVVCVGIFAYRSSDDVSTPEGFRAYASEKLAETVVYGPVTHRTFTKFELDDGVGVAVSGDRSRYSFVDQARDRYVEKLKKRAKEQSGDGFRSVIVNSAVCESGRGSVSLLVTYTEAEKKGRGMKQTGAGFETWNFNTETGRELRWEQVFEEGYEGIEKKLPGDEPIERDEYVLSRSDIAYPYVTKDEGTGLDVVKAERFLPRYYEDVLRDEVLARYIDPDKPMVALTYDDGPGLESEDRIHDVLEKNGAVATFFYSGYMIKGKKKQLRRSLANGCEVGGHTWNHPVLTRCSKKDLKKQLYKTHILIKKVTGEAPTVFRPSYGITNEKVNKMANKPVILWDVDTLDWKTRNANKIVKSVKKKKNLDGRIILMHCIYDETAAATEKLVPWLEKQGYQTVTVSELIKYKTGKDPKPGKVYYELYKKKGKSR